jgi:hypothetical protein
MNEQNIKKKITISLNDIYRRLGQWSLSVVGVGGGGEDGCCCGGDRGCA